MNTSRWDIEALRVVVIIAALLGATSLVTGVVGIGYEDGSGVSLVRSEASGDGPTLYTSVAPEELGLEPVDGFVPREVSGDLNIAGAARVLHIIATVTIAVGLLAAAYAFFGLLSDAARADPFVRRNVWRWHIIAGGLLLWLVGMFVDSFAHMEAKAAAGFELSASWNFGLVIAVLAAGAMARVWDIGVGLREEQELTV